MSDKDINVMLYNDKEINVVLREDNIAVTIQSTIGTVDIYSSPPSGCYRIVNIYLNADKHIVIVYDETPEA